MQIGILSAKSEHLFHISAPLQRTTKALKNTFKYNYKYFTDLNYESHTCYRNSISWCFMFNPFSVGQVIYVGAKKHDLALVLLVKCSHPAGLSDFLSISAMIILFQNNYQLKLSK